MAVCEYVAVEIRGRLVDAEMSPDTLRHRLRHDDGREGPPRGATISPELTGRRGPGGPEDLLVRSERDGS